MMRNGLQPDAAHSSRRGDGLEHGGEISITVLQDFDRIPFYGHRIGQGESRAKKFRITGGKRMLKMIFERVSPNKEDAKQRNDSADCQDEADPFANGKFPQLGVEPVIISFSTRHFLN